MTQLCVKCSMTSSDCITGIVTLCPCDKHTSYLPFSSPPPAGEEAPTEVVSTHSNSSWPVNRKVCVYTHNSPCPTKMLTCFASHTLIALYTGSSLTPHPHPPPHLTHTQNTTFSLWCSASRSSCCPSECQPCFKDLISKKGHFTYYSGTCLR